MSYTITYVDDGAKPYLRAKADDGIHGVHNVMFPKGGQVAGIPSRYDKNNAGVQVEVKKLVWNTRGFYNVEAGDIIGLVNPVVTSAQSTSQVSKQQVPTQQNPTVNPAPSAQSAPEPEEELAEVSIDAPVEDTAKVPEDKTSDSDKEPTFVEPKDLSFRKLDPTKFKRFKAKQTQTECIHLDESLF